MGGAPAISSTAMTSAWRLRDRLRGLGAQLAMSPRGTLLVDAPAGLLTPGRRALVSALRDALLDRLRREARLLALGAGTTPPYQRLTWTAQGVTLGATEAVWRESVSKLPPLALGALTAIAARRAAGLGAGDRRSLAEAVDDPVREAPPESGPDPVVREETSASPMQQLDARP